LGKKKKSRKKKIETRKRKGKRKEKKEQRRVHTYKQIKKDATTRFIQDNQIADEKNMWAITIQMVSRQSIGKKNRKNPPKRTNSKNISDSVEYFFPSLCWVGCCTGRFKACPRISTLAL
jgi:hypothetical protein